MKPKRLPRLWCALQGLLPFDLEHDLMPDRFAGSVEPRHPVEPLTKKIPANDPPGLARLTEG